MYRILIVFFMCTLWVCNVYADEEEFKTKLHNAFQEYDVEDADRLGRKNGINFSETAESLTEGSFEININEIISFVWKKLFSEVLLQSELMKTVFCLCILCGVIKFIGSGFSGGVSDISFYVCFMGAVGCVTVSFAAAGDIAVNTAKDLENVLKACVPLICSAAVVSGGGGGMAVMLPITGVITETAVKLAEVFFVPMINICGGIAIVNYFSQKQILTKLSDFTALIVNWTLKGFTVLALSVMGIYRIGNVQASQTAMKVIKAGAEAVPVIGDILSGSVQTVTALGQLVKSGMGIAAAILITACVFVPFVKILAIVAAYKITALAIQPLGEKAITDCVDTAGNIIAMFLGVIIMMIVVFISMVLIFISINGG